MKVMSIQGSPRRNGNTATLLGWIEKDLKDAGHSVDHVDLTDFSVQGCGECLRCQDVLDAPGCSVRDGANGIFERMCQAELIVLATPMFFWQPTAQLKALIDRSICLCKIRDERRSKYLLDGKRLALVATAGGPRDGNMDLLEETFSRYVEYMHCEEAGAFLVPHCTRPSELGPDLRERARVFAEELAEV